MTKIIPTICAAAAFAVALGSLPASAASIQYGDAQLQNAQVTFGFSSGDRRDGRFERRGDYYYFNGQRGYRERRDGFRFYNGFWFPNSAFSFGFSFGNDRDRGWRDRDDGWRDRPVRMSARHIAWCEDRYRSYRASDNTFQPYNGPRQQCVSPYSR